MLSLDDIQTLTRFTTENLKEEIARRAGDVRGFPAETEAEALRRKHAFFPVAFSSESSSVSNLNQE